MEQGSWLALEVKVPSRTEFTPRMQQFVARNSAMRIGSLKQWLQASSRCYQAHIAVKTTC